MKYEGIRPVMTVQKLAKAEAAFMRMANMLECSLSLPVHREIDLSFYQQKIAEFALLRKQLQEALDAVEYVKHRAALHYQAAYPVWRANRRWLQRAGLPGGEFKSGEKYR